MLRCPACRADGSLLLHAEASDDTEVREGSLACAGCNASFAVVNGIVDLLYEPPDFVLRESNGLDRFAEVMRADGWDGTRLRALPHSDDPYWHGQRGAMAALLDRAAFTPGERIVDVGSNTCWASNIFAARGLEVIALDIAMNDLQGLRAAEHFLGRNGVFFERLRSVMFAPAIASATIDCVFCCEVLHHNDPHHLRATFRELHRILRPGGRLFVINEPMRFPLRPKRDHGVEVAQYEGNEHVYFLYQYYLAARAAGFRPVIPALSRLARRRRRIPNLWRYLIAGDAALSMDCRK